MPLRADAPAGAGATGADAIGASRRAKLELTFRIVALGALSVALWSTIFPLWTSAKVAAPTLFRADTIAQQNSRSLLTIVRTSLLGGNTPSPLHLVATRVPTDTNRALLTATQLAGIPVSWTDSIQGGIVALEVRSRIDPRGGYSLRVAAPDGAKIAIRDSLGLIDSVTASGGGASTVAGRVAGSVSATTSTAQALSMVPEPATIRRVLVLAQPGWEGKFTVAALEERGWIVEVRYDIGKNVTVTQGSPIAPDTARYAAVVALDSSALPHIAAIRRYAFSGGGVVVAGVATTLREFGALLPGRIGTRQPGVPGGLETDTPLAGLGWRPITPDSDASIIARSTRVAADAKVAAIVARRFGAGRVVESAYDGVWQWRMAGPDGSVAAHRDWWSTLVSAAAYAPEQATSANGAPLNEDRDAPGGAAPFADARARFGKPSPIPASVANTRGFVNWDFPLVILALLCLLAEWTSRRLRGAK